MSETPVTPDLQDISKPEAVGSKIFGCIFGCLFLFIFTLCVLLFAGDLVFSFIKGWLTSKPFSLSAYFLDNYPDLLKGIGIMIFLLGFTLVNFKITSSFGLWLVDLSSAILVVIVSIGVAVTSASIITMFKPSPVNYLPQLTNDISIGIRIGSYVGVPAALIQLLFVSFLRYKEIISNVGLSADYFLEMLPIETFFFLMAGIISGSIAGYERFGWVGGLLGLATGIVIPIVFFIKMIKDKAK
jgi:hypothetical protein